MQLMLDFTERHRDTVGVLASGLRSAVPVKSLIRSGSEHFYSLALLVSADGLSPRRTAERTLPDLVIPQRNKLPPNVVGLYISLNVSRTYLAEIDRLIWYFDPFEPYYTLHTPANSCALNVVLALYEGIPVECRDLRDQVCPLPTHLLNDSRIRTQFRNWIEWHREFTTAIVREGLTLAPGWCEPVLWSGGGIDAGKLAISMTLVRRIEHLRMWCDAHWDRDDITTPDVLVANRELDAIAAELRGELGPDLRIKIEHLED